MLVQAFNEIFVEKYLLGNLSQTIGSTKVHFAELNMEMNNSVLLSALAILLFERLKTEHSSLLIDIQKPIEQMCAFANGTEKDIDQMLLDTLDIMHTELKRVNETMREDILSKITPWNEHMLMDAKLEADIRKYINIGGTVLLVLVILFGVIPFMFLCSILICRICGCCQNESEDNEFVFFISSLSSSSVLIDFI